MNEQNLNAGAMWDSYKGYGFAFWLNLTYIRHVIKNKALKFINEACIIEGTTPKFVANNV
jgi:hypothetical protein